MAWKTPKTNWTPEYRWDKDDINRIQDNLMYIKDNLYPILFNSAVNYTSMNLNKTYTSHFYASEMNNIENNLKELNKKTFRFDLGDTLTYSANQPMPDYVEFNRIENGILKIYTAFQADIAILTRLPFQCGNEGGM